MPKPGSIRQPLRVGRKLELAIKTRKESGYSCVPVVVIEDDSEHRSLGQLEGIRKIREEDGEIAL